MANIDFWLNIYWLAFLAVIGLSPIDAQFFSSFLLTDFSDLLGGVDRPLFGTLFGTDDLQLNFIQYATPPVVYNISTETTTRRRWDLLGRQNAVDPQVDKRQKVAASLDGCGPEFRSSIGGLRRSKSLSCEIEKRYRLSQDPSSSLQRAEEGSREAIQRTDQSESN